MWTLKLPAAFGSMNLSVNTLQEQFVTTGLAGLVLTLFFLIAKLYKRPSKGPLPPQIPGVPILGNFLQLSGRSWLTFTEWQKTYGPLFYLNLGGQPAVVINSAQIASDLLDRRAAIYSDRPRNIVASKILTNGLIFVFSQHTDLWRRMRRASHEALNPHAVRNYHNFQERESVILVDELLRDPQNYDNHFRRASMSLVLSIVYGRSPLTDSNDPVIARINNYTETALAAAAPGAFLVEYFTWMQYLPRWMTPWRTWAEKIFQSNSIFVEGLFQDVKEKLDYGDQTESVSSNIIRNQNERNLTDTQAAWAGFTLTAAGAETTSGMMAWFMLTMVLHPEEQRRAQEEIDRVVGRDRMPAFQDYDYLPYVKALVKECMRWRGTSPLSVPHRLSQDDWYNGYFLPKDTICFINVWHLNHDPNIYGEDADMFRPERYLDDNGALKPAVPETKDESHFSYGFGRRICVGRHIANNILFIEMAALLWAFNIGPGKDVDGNIVLPDAMDCIDSGLAVRPVPFPCTIAPRFTEVQSVVTHTKDRHEVS